MKKIFYITLCIAVLFIGCEEEKSPVEPDPTPNEVIIPQTTKPISQSDFNSYFTSISIDSTEITFNSSITSNYNFQLNDIIVIENEEGILGKIKGIQATGNTVILTIEQASITEAIERGSGSFNQILTSSMIKNIPENQGIHLSHLNKTGDVNSIVLNIDQILYDHDNNFNTTGDQIKVTGSLELGPTINGEFIIEDFQLKKIDVNYQITESIKITGSVGILNLSAPVVKHEFPPINFNPIIVLVGTVPIVITPQLVISTGVDLQINSQATMSIEQSMNYTTGMKYENGNWSTYKEIDTSFTFTPPTVSLDFGAKAFISPELRMKIYGTVSPYLQADLFGRLIVTPFQNPIWKLYAGLEIGGGVKMKIWKKTLFDYSFTFFNFELPIAQATTGGNAPNPPTLFSPSNGATNVSIPPSLVWNVSSGATSYTLQVSPNSNFTSFVYNQSGLTGTSQQVGGLNNNTTYYWRVSATNNYGTSSWSSVWNFTTTGPVSGKKMLYLKYGDPSNWTIPGASGSQAEEISRWENAGFDVTTMDLSSTTITSSLLNSYDILRLYSYKGRGYTANESNAISNFVTNGGNLFADVPHTSDVSAVSFFGVDNIIGNNGGSNGLNWFYHGAPYVFGPIAGPTSTLSTMAIECMDRPVLKSNHSLTIDATVEGYPAIAHGSFGSGKIVLMFVVSWSHDATYPGNAYRANIYQEQNLQFLQNCILYFN